MEVTSGRIASMTIVSAPTETLMNQNFIPVQAILAKDAYFFRSESDPPDPFNTQAGSLLRLSCYLRQYLRHHRRRPRRKDSLS
jgi:hypothetical protein